MEEISVKGIILDARPQGEYGRRILMLTDRLGKITAFAGGAAKQGSKLQGAVRPFTAAGFILAKGKNSYSIHGAEVMDSFGELPADPDNMAYAYYLLELTEYFSEEGMPENEAKALLNLTFTAFTALRAKTLDVRLLTAVYELRLLKLQGEYTERPQPVGKAFEPDEINVMWQYALNSPLTRLFDKNAYESPYADGFIQSVGALFKRQVPHTFRTLRILREI